jgi:putative ABC transport system permease protein
MLGRRSVPDEVREEVRFHLEARTQELIAQGQTPEAAAAQARAEFGDVSAAQQELTAIDYRREDRAVRLERWRGLLQDARVALRTYVREPGFALTVVLLLGLGIGANTAMFSVVNAALLRPLPYHRPDRLVHLVESYQGDVASISEASWPDFLDWQAEGRAFAAVAGYDEGNLGVSDGSGAAEFLRAARVTSGFLSVLGVAPAVGSFFDRGDDVPGGTPAVVLSHGFWTRRFGADPAVVGRSIRIDGVPFEIRGVLPAGFRFAPVGDAELWVPISRSPEIRSQRFNHWINAVGRLKDGVGLDQARSRMDEVMRDLATRYPETNTGRGAVLTPLTAEATGGVERPLLVLLGAVSIVLLISCANVACLFLARSVKRADEIALRVALGATRGRIVAQLLTENLVLVAAGAVAGALAAPMILRLLVGVLPAGLVEQLPSLEGAAVDPRVLGFSLLMAAATGLVFGLAPALAASSRKRSRHRLRNGLVTGEIALTMVLLVAATLMGQSLFALLRVETGFTAEQVATVRVALAGPAWRDGPRRTRFFEDLVAGVGRVPGVEAAGAVSSAPLQGGGTNTFRVVGAPELPPGQRREANARAVAGDYFNALRIPLREGRTLNAGDHERAPYALVISASLARRLFGDRPAVGERLGVYAWGDSTWTIVGVVGDVKTDALDAESSPTIYYSHRQGPANRMSVVARTGGSNPGLLIPAMRAAVAALDPGVPVYQAQTMTEYVERSGAVAARRYLLVLLGGFAAVALLLAVIGVYGVIAFSVAQRNRELAIRMALGATAQNVVALVSRGGFRILLWGAAIGVVAALAVTRVMGSLLFGVGAADPRSYGLVLVTLSAVMLAACYVPARRATRVDPARTLRSE